MALEIEVKFRIEDSAKIVEKLKELGAERVNSGFESNISFDKNGELKRAGNLVRLRSYDGHADITYKKHVSSDKFSIREETIVKIDSFENGKRLLEALGFKPIWIYEKKRQTWEFDGVGILVDAVPIGNFVEIEGPEEKIAETAEKLGLDMRDALPLSYGELFMEHCKEKGIPLHDMVFKEEEK